MGWRPGARLFGTWVLSGCWWHMCRWSPILGSREVRWLTAQPLAVAVSPRSSSLILRPVLVSPRVPGPSEARVPLSSAQLGLQIRSEARRRRAAQPPRPTPGPLARPARPSSRPATGAPGRRRYHPFLARHFLPAQSAVSAHLGAGAQPSALPLFFAPCLGVRNLDVAVLITLCILNDWGHTSRSSYYPCLLPCSFSHGCSLVLF